jgi:hypothetical protein
MCRNALRVALGEAASAGSGSGLDGWVLPTSPAPLAHLICFPRDVMHQALLGVHVLDDGLARPVEEAARESRAHTMTTKAGSKSAQRGSEERTHARTGGLRARSAAPWTHAEPH